MNLSHLLRQTTQWEAISSFTDRDDHVYAPAVLLPCRSVEKLRDIIGRDGEVTTATNTVMLAQEVGIGDKLDGREVIGLTAQVTVGGAIIGYLAFTR